MQDLPHRYRVSTVLDADGLVSLENDNAPVLRNSAPPEFDGPEGHWSPETMLVASVASCFLLSFRAVARASKLEWRSLSCDVSGVLERIDKQMKFTEFHLHATLSIERSEDVGKAERLLKKSDETCLISNSLTAETTLATTITTLE